LALEQALVQKRAAASHPTIRRLSWEVPGDDPLLVYVSRRRMLPKLARRRVKMLGQIARSLAPWRRRRDTELVSEVYEDSYDVPSLEYVRRRDKRRDVFRVEGRYVFGNGWFIVRSFHHLWRGLIDQLEVGSVLEVGSGRGTNLALLALARPGLSLTGLELTRAGVEQSRALVADPPERYSALAGIGAVGPDQRAALARTRFHEGNAFAMPFEDKSFDFSFTCLALEQMPVDYTRVVAEMRRTTRSYCAFLEPFAEANDRWERLYLRRLDYFRASYRSFADRGLEPIFFTTDFPQKTHFGTGLLLTRVLD
jgi:SAM-dependent methyltransferase